MIHTGKKRILLISPFGNIPNYWFPLSLGYLKSNIPNEKYEVKILDCTLEAIPAESKRLREEIKNYNPFVVGVTTVSPTYPEGIKIFNVVKSINKKIITVMGGSHPSIYSDEVIKNKFVDFVFRGESELMFPKFLDIVNEYKPNFHQIKGLVFKKNGEIIKNELNIEKDLDKIKIPDYEALKLDEYLEQGYRYGGFFGKNSPIWVTRGCPYNCSFCSASLLNGRIIRTHSVDYMVKWIEYLYKKFEIRQFNIIDDNFTFNIEYAKEFCRRFIKLRKEKFFEEKIHFSTPNGIRMQRVDDELLSLMKEAGWTDITVAPESGSIKTLQRMRKGITPDIVPGIVKRIKAAGLSVRGFFIVGYPGETMEDIKKTVGLIRKCDFDFFNVGKFFPIPGTPIFQELIKNGEIKPNYIPDYNYSMMMSFKKDENIYTPKELKNFNLPLLLLREYFLLFLRNPYSFIWVLKFYGISRVFKIIMFVKKRKKVLQT